MNDPYASEADTKALLQRDTRTPAEKKLDQMLDERWANEQGVDAVGVLRQIAIELIAQQAEAVPEMHDALCPALTGGDCTCTHLTTVDKAWAQFCGGIGRGPDAPYPGMIEAFESHYGQRFTDKDWREETGVWAAAWKAAKAHGEEAPQQAEAVPPKRATGWVAPKDRYTTPVLFNPYTGAPRDARDVQSDPQGILIVPPGALISAAQGAKT